MSPYEKDVSEMDTSTMDQGPGMTFEDTVNRLRDQAQVAMDSLAREVQAHPLRTLAIVGAVGFVLASSIRRGVLPAMLKSGLGIAAAVALRQAAERGLTGVWTPGGDSAARPD